MQLIGNREGSYEERRSGNLTRTRELTKDEHCQHAVHDRMTQLAQHEVPALVLGDPEARSGRQKMTAIYAIAGAHLTMALSRPPTRTSRQRRPANSLAARRGRDCPRARSNSGGAH